MELSVWMLPGYTAKTVILGQDKPFLPMSPFAASHYFRNTLGHLWDHTIPMNHLRTKLGDRQSDQPQQKISRRNNSFINSYLYRDVSQSQEYHQIFVFTITHHQESGPVRWQKVPEWYHQQSSYTFVQAEPPVLPIWSRYAPTYILLLHLLTAFRVPGTCSIAFTLPQGQMPDRKMWTELWDGTITLD